jgi:lipopolysaccharide export LptBFGC system permease protein LptF
LIALGVYLGFYVFSRVGVQLGERGFLPPWVAGHLPVVVAFIFGVLLLLRVERRGAR